MPGRGFWSHPHPRVLALILSYSCALGCLPSILPSFRPACLFSLSTPVVGSSFPSFPRPQCLPAGAAAANEPPPFRPSHCMGRGERGGGTGGKEGSPSAPTSRLRARLAFPDQEKGLMLKGAEQLALQEAEESEGSEDRVSVSLSLPLLTLPPSFSLHFHSEKRWGLLDTVWQVSSIPRPDCPYNERKEAPAAAGSREPRQDGSGFPQTWCLCSGKKERMERKREEGV